jgi:hypothetical protein
MRVKNDSLEYEITIFEPGFDFWLIGNARPRGFYGLEYLETYNRFYTTYWNIGFLGPNRQNLSQFYIDYDPKTKYGYEVNYLLFNYFQYYMDKTGKTLGSQRRIR